MRKNDNAFPHFSSIDELAAYVDAHDVGDKLDAMPEAHFDVDLMISARKATPEERRQYGEHER